MSEQKKIAGKVFAKKKIIRPKTLWKNIPKVVKTAFFSCFLAGFIIHIFAFSNIIPNSDGLSRVYDLQQMTVSGRWFLHYATAFNGYIQMPAVIGFFSVLFISFAAALVVSMLGIKRKILGALCGILMIAFPSVAYTYLYMFTASAYFFGILLAVLAVWLARRYKFGYLFAPILLACALGTYQAYLAVAVALSIICVLLFALEEKERDAKTIFFYALKYIAFLLISLVLYFVILKLFLWAKDLELLSYKSADSMLSSFSIKGILASVYLAYKQVIGYFLVGAQFCPYATPLLKGANAILLLLAGFSFFLIIKKKKHYQKPLKLILILGILFVLPLGLNLTALMGENTAVMYYALVFTYVAALVLIDRATSFFDFKGISLRAIGCGALVLVIFSSFLTSNLVYTTSAQAHRASLTFATNLASRVESLEGYKSDMEVLVIGSFPSSVYSAQIPIYQKVSNYYCSPDSLMPLNKHIYYYMNNWLNIQWREPEEELMIKTAKSKEFKKMPLYPSDGSVAIIENRVVVKLAKEYTPKADFEIAYEKRR